MAAGAVAASEHVETLHFDYSTGKTIVTVYDVARKKVIKLEQLAAYPTPLADEELAQAKELARARDKRVRELYAKYGEKKVTVDALTPVIASPKDKRFGKRLTILTLTPKEHLPDTVSVTVDLTDKTVSRK